MPSTDFRSRPALLTQFTNVQPPPSFEAIPAGQILSAAKLLVSEHGLEYSFSAAPTSPHSRLSGNRSPGKTQLFWLKDRYKCNQFVGDVLTLAGLRMPTYRMPDGSEHYVNAEALPKYNDHFQRIASSHEIRQGDLLVIDRLSASGENGAHVEIISSYNLETATLSSLGAHRDGAYQTTKRGFFSGLSPRNDTLGGYFIGLKSKVYILRPRAD